MNDLSILISKLSIRYNNSYKNALDIEDLKIKKGEFVAVIGPSGSGKTTFLRTLVGLVKPTSGDVTINGIKLTKSSLGNVRKEVSMVFQNYNLVPRTSVLNNVLMGRLAHKTGIFRYFTTFSKADKNIAIKALSQVGLQNYYLEDTQSLSGGQKQRVAIARSLAQESSLILADEPISSLDPKNAESVIQLLKSLSEENNITVLVNLHQKEIVEKYFDKIICIKDGSIEQVIDNKDSFSEVNFSQVYA